VNFLASTLAEELAIVGLGRLLVINMLHWQLAGPSVMSRVADAYCTSYLIVRGASNWVLLLMRSDLAQLIRVQPGNCRLLYLAVRGA